MASSPPPRREEEEERRQDDDEDDDRITSPLCKNNNPGKVVPAVWLPCRCRASSLTTAPYLPCRCSAAGTVGIGVAQVAGG